MDSGSFDSTLDTLDHIQEVQSLMRAFSTQLAQRAEQHDRSKLEEPEKSAFDQLGANLRGLTYGSDEYRAQLKKIKPALDHHYAANNHHPEHYESGVSGMTLIDLVEMACDWLAASKRHEDGDIQRSVTINAQRFALDPQLVAILRNTYELFGHPMKKETS